MAASCGSCGSPIRWVNDDERGRVPLDVHEVSRGPHRYAVQGSRLVAVRADADVLAFTDHRMTCPAR